MNNVEKHFAVRHIKQINPLDLTANLYPNVIFPFLSFPLACCLMLLLLLRVQTQLLYIFSDTGFVAFHEHFAHTYEINIKNSKQGEMNKKKMEEKDC